MDITYLLAMSYVTVQTVDYGQNFAQRFDY